MNLVHALAAHVRDRPDSPAIIDVDRGAARVTTFAQLEEASCRAATLLHDSGLAPGDAVLVFYPMSAELYIALIAIFRRGLVAMFLDPSAGREHIERCCELHAPAALLAGTKAHLLRLTSRALRRIPRKFVIGFPFPFATRWSRINRLPPLKDIHPVEPDAPALLTFTSGSTGQPKAAVRTHGFLLAQHRTLAESLTLTAGDVDLATLPIVLLANLASGVASVVPNADLRYPGAIAPAPVVDQMLRHQVVSSVASPAFFERLARFCEKIGITFPGVRKLYTGGAPVFPRLLDRLAGLAPGAEVIALYGSTEAEPIAHVSHKEMDSADRLAMRSGAGLLAGVPVEAIRLRILRDQWGTPIGPFSKEEFDASCRGADEPGEIVVAGEHVLKGYLHGQGDHETKFRAGEDVWHRTGDAGYLDERGRLWLLGRCSARINDAHGELYPFAVEAAASAHPVVHRSALVCREGKRLLVVEPVYPLPADELAELQKALAWSHVEVRQVKHIPVDKRHNAKVDYPALAKMLDASPAR
jgi:acyl-CoA synthetase (AMP-forming)/AMP-acid ligase II